MATDLTLAKALLDRVGTLSTSRPIAWPGVDFTPPSDGSGWLEVRLFPNQPNNITHSGKQQYIGFLQVAVVDREGAGVINAITDAEGIIAHFPKGLQVGATRVRAAPYISPPIHEGGNIYVPVTVPYQGIANTT